MLMTLHECNSFTYLLSLIFLSLKLDMYCLILQELNLYIGGFRVCCKCTWFLVVNERCTPGGQTVTCCDLPIFLH